jgi:hypothetical protein
MSEMRIFWPIATLEPALGPRPWLPSSQQRCYAELSIEDDGDLQTSMIPK